ncbi:MAG: hypothetical protein FJ319_02535 [SAR202 cluster bacterium]|nr:hypothetical protein [SAR202 cluster bacterium]
MPAPVGTVTPVATPDPFSVHVLQGKLALLLQEQVYLLSAAVEAAVEDDGDSVDEDATRNALHRNTEKIEALLALMLGHEDGAGGTPTVTPTGTPGGAQTGTPTGTPTGAQATATPTAAATGTPSGAQATATPTGTATAAATATPTGTATAVSTATATGTATAVSTATPTGTATAVSTAAPTGTATVVMNGTPTGAGTVVPTGTPVGAGTVTPTPTGTPAAMTLGDLFDRILDITENSTTTTRTEDLQEIEDMMSDFHAGMAERLGGADPNIDADHIEAALNVHGEIILRMVGAHLRMDKDAATEATMHAAMQVPAVAARLAAAIAATEPVRVKVVTDLLYTVDLWNMRNAEAFTERFTEQAFEEEFGTAEDLQMFIGDPPIVFVMAEDLTVTSTTAGIDLTLAFGNSVQLTRESLLLEDGVWKFNGSEDMPAPVPAGVTPLNVEIGEFYFSFSDAGAQRGPVAFRARNPGLQPHELVLVKLSDDAPALLELVQSDEEPPAEQVQFLGFTFAMPGEEGSMVFLNSLEAARYGMVCFISDQNDPNGTPHALKGMIAEFEVTDDSQ